MVVAHNILAMNAQRMLGITTDKQKKSTEKLSSGYRVNRAADDAAGLSISEKMRKQIRGLNRASTNASDGVSAVQTAEGALNEVQSMLHRMNELAVQSANGTNSVSDRTAIQNEIDQLTTEIDRVAETTKFNETYLLKGDKNQNKKVSWRYNNNVSSVTVTYAVPKDKTTGLAVSGKWNWGGSQDDANFLLRSMRDSGFYVSQTKIYDAATDGVVTSYSLELTGEAAQRYDVVAVSTYSTDNLLNTLGETEECVFSIQTKGGEEIFRFAVTGGNAPDPTSTDQIHTSSAVVTSEYVTAAKRAGEQAQYYDKDGNKIPENALDRYFSLTSGSVQSASGKAESSGSSSSGSSGASGSSGTSGSSGASSSTGGVGNINRNTLDSWLRQNTARKGTWNFDGTNWTHSSNSSLTYSSTSAFSSATGIPITGTPKSGDTINIQATESSYDKYDVTTTTSGVTLDLKESAVIGSVVETDIIGRRLTYNGYSWDSTSGMSIRGDKMTEYFTVTSGDWTPSPGDTITVPATKTTYTTVNSGSVNYTRGSSGGSGGSGGGSGSGSGGGSVGKVKDIAPKPGGGLVYDAVGNLTSLNPANVNARRDLWGDVGLNIHVGADATRENKIQINIACMSSKNLGINGMRVDGRDDTNALKAIDTIKEALQKVSDQRAVLGAAQNRLEHTINNLENVVENTEAAESRIRDTDMAEEMVTFSKNNILAQAGQSMLAQANQSNQGVVSLLG